MNKQTERQEILNEIVSGVAEEVRADPETDLFYAITDRIKNKGIDPISEEEDDYLQQKIVELIDK